MSLGRSAKYSLHRFGGVLPLAGQHEVIGLLARPPLLGHSGYLPFGLECVARYGKNPIRVEPKSGLEIFAHGPPGFVSRLF